VPTAFTATTEVARPDDDVWAALTDWDRAEAWMSGVTGLEADGPTAVGTTLTFTTRRGQRRATITAVDPGRRLVLRSEQGPVTADYRYEVAPTAPGRTTVTLVADCAVRGPMAVLAPVLRRSLRRADGEQLEALRAVLEAPR